MRLVVAIVPLLVVGFVASCLADNSQEKPRRSSDFKLMELPDDIFDEGFFGINWGDEIVEMTTPDATTYTFELAPVDVRELILAWYSQERVFGLGTGSRIAQLSDYGLKVEPTNQFVAFGPSEDCGLSESILNVFDEFLEYRKVGSSDRYLRGMYPVFGVYYSEAGTVRDKLSRLLGAKKCLSLTSWRPNELPMGRQVFWHNDEDASLEYLFMSRTLILGDRLVDLDRIFALGQSPRKLRCESVHANGLGCVRVNSVGVKSFWMRRVAGELMDGG